MERERERGRVSERDKETITAGIARALQLVGSLKSWVSFAKEPHKRDDILQKRPIILRSLLMVATPSQLHGLAFSIDHRSVIFTCSSPSTNSLTYGG